MSLSPSPDETTLTERVLQSTGSSENDHLGPEAAVELFLSSGLTPEVLAEIWRIADVGEKGFLSRDEVTVALRLVGWAQRGVVVTAELTVQDGPLATLEGLTLTVARGPADKKLPPISPHSKRGYYELFEGAGPRDGLLNGKYPIQLLGYQRQNVWRLLSKSALPSSLLSAIWDLVDEQKDGYFRFPEFCLAMYFVRGLLERSLTDLPSSISPELYKQVQDPPPSPALTQPTYEPPPSPLNRKRAKSTMHAPTLPLYEPPPSSLNLKRALSYSPQTQQLPHGLEPRQQQYEIPRSPSNFTRSPPSTFLLCGSPIEKEELARWDLNSSFSDVCRQKFGEINVHGEQEVHGEMIVPFLLRSGLSEQILSNIWDIADPQQTGRLSQEGFTVALFLVYRALFGLEVPQVIPAIFLSVLEEQSHIHVSSDEDEPAPPVPAKDTMHQTNRASLRPVPRTPTLPPKPEEYKPDLPVSQDVNALQAECQRMKRMLAAIDRENESLRSSLDEARRVQTELDEARSQLATRSAENERLRSELGSSDEVASQLRKSVKVTEQVKQENVLLHGQVDDLTEKLQGSLAEVEVQKLLQEELKAEAENLRRQTQELRESLHVPSSGGDEELQMLINEDISRENGRLRRQVQELTDSVSQLQAASEERDAQRQSERALTRENHRLKRQIRQLEGDATETQTQLRRRVEELSEESRRLREGLQTTRSRASQGSGRRNREAEDVAPPAYEEIETV
ncbi:hypothetical protein V5O48_001120 [Marasmius crinis-equi]|uniref:Uncharacterized protein n=1 Tax=Marasmius crinis-equi TaxID=585013 RepID=A0ABR3FZC6_9AGAR